MPNTDFLARFIMRFDPVAPRRDPSWLALGSVIVCVGAILSIASLQPLAVAGGVLALVGVVTAAALREEAVLKEGLEFDEELVQNYWEVRIELSKGRLGDRWEPEVAEALERCSCAWAKVNRCLARRRWIYKTLTKTWRDLWSDTRWAADSAMLEALWSAQRSCTGATVLGSGLGRSRAEALLHLRQTTAELESLAYHVARDVFAKSAAKTAVQAAIDDLKVADRSREELERDVPHVT